MKEILEKYNFVKTEKNKWVFWDDYLLSDINSKYPYFLYCTIHIPRNKKLKEETVNIEYDCTKIILHRHYNLEYWNEDDSNQGYYDTKLVYEGLLETEEDLLFLLNKLYILPTLS